MTDLTALRELAKELARGHVLDQQIGRADRMRVGRTYLVALDVVEAAERVDNDFAGFGKDIARCSRQSAQNLRNALARFKEATDE